MREALLTLAASDSQADLGDGDPGGWDLLMRVKAQDRIHVKMARKRLRAWEVGDLLGFFLVVRSLAALVPAARCVDGRYGPDVLYKQDGFHDIIACNMSFGGRRLDLALGRRVFYVIRHDDAVCFELQLVTLRQAIYLHLAHPCYLGTPGGDTDRDALDAFGDRAYLLDLLDLEGANDLGGRRQ